MKFFLLIFPTLLTGLAAHPLEAQETTSKYAGTYRIESWQDLESKNLYHFFYLHPDGNFLLGAEWPERETSRAVGSWRVDGNHLSMTGQVAVKTNQGHWRVPFTRTFKIIVKPNGIGLEPMPRKNRYGLLGWPDSYFFFRTLPSSSLPSGEIPQTEKNIRAMIEALREAWK